MITPPYRAVRFCLVFLLAMVTVSFAAAQTPDGQTVIEPTRPTGPPWLGVMLEKGTGDEAGVKVTGALRRSPSDGTGVEAGDVIVEIDGKPVSSLREVKRAVRARAIGDTVTVQVDRSGTPRTLEFTLREMPGAEEVVRRHLVGYPAPDFDFQYVGDGDTMSLSELRGKPTIIDFWATWCAPCHRTQAELALVKTEFGDKINIVGVSAEPSSKIRAHLKRSAARYAMAEDVNGGGHSGFAVSSFPTIVILDAEHRVAAVIFGAGKRELIEKKIANLVD